MKKRIRKAIASAVYAFILSLVLLVLTIISYSTVTVTLIQTRLSLLFQVLTFLYSWPFMIFAFIMDFLGIDVFNMFFLVFISSITYALIGFLIGYYAKKRGKSHRNR